MPDLPPFLLIVSVLVAVPAGAGSPDAPAAGRDRLCGQALDPTGAAVADARTVLRSARSGRQQTAVTDGAGRFRFERVVAGPYELRVEKDGFEAAMRGIAAGDFGCERELPMPLVLPRVSESVSVDAPPGHDSAIGAAVSRREDFELRNNRRVGDVLRRMPGVLMSGAPAAWWTAARPAC